MDQLQYLGHCPVCNTQYEKSHSSVIAENGATATVYVECGNCETSVVVIIMGETRGLVSIAGMLTDLTREDLDRLQNKSPLTLDDALEMHMHLEKLPKRGAR